MNHNFKTEESLQISSVFEHSIDQGSEHHQIIKTPRSAFSEQIIHQVNQSTSKIINQIAQLQMQIHNDNIDSFQSRQKTFVERKQQNIQLLKETQEQKLKANIRLTPSINKNPQTQQMINHYMKQSINSKQGALLKKQDRFSQTVKSVKLKHSKFEFNEAGDYENQDDDGIAIQTVKQVAKKQYKPKPEELNDCYIPLWDRANYIIQSKNDKISERQAEQQEKYEEWIRTLPFKPQTEKCQETKQSITIKEAEEFAENQVKWRKQADDWLAQQQIIQLNQSPTYTYRPQISKRKQSEHYDIRNTPKDRHNKSMHNQILTGSTNNSKTARHTLSSTNKLHTDTRGQLKREKEMQELFKYL